MRVVTTTPPPPPDAGQPQPYGTPPTGTPAYGQPGGYPPQPQQPYGQPYPPQAYAQQPYPPQQSAQQPYTQPQAYAQQPYPPAAAQPVQRRSFLVPGLVIGALVGIAAIFAAATLLSRGPDPQTAARETGERLFAALFAGDCRGVQEATSQTCFDDVFETCEEVRRQAEGARDLGITYEITDVTMRDEDTVRVTIALHVAEYDERQTGVMLVEQRGGDWVVVANE